MVEGGQVLDAVETVVAVFSTYETKEVNNSKTSLIRMRVY